jgi:hemin uptake protein HemP
MSAVVRTADSERSRRFMTVARSTGSRVLRPSETEKHPEEGQPEGQAKGVLKKGVIAFEELAEGQAEIVIEYRGQCYRLRTTRNGGLILNK